MVNTGLGVGFAIALAASAIRLEATGNAWLFDLCVGAAICVAALLRERGRGWAALVGLVIVTTAMLVARASHLPGEPGAAATLAMLVLGSSALRTVKPWPSAAIAIGGFALMTASSLSADPTHNSHPAPTQFGVTGWLAAIGCGLGLRVLDVRQRTVAETIRRDERLVLARELHDVVAHHLTGIVLQAQAARIVGQGAPERLSGTLAGIEGAGTDALAAMRRVIGLLREADDGGGTTTSTPKLEQLTELVEHFEGLGPKVQLKLPADEAVLPPEVATTIYRIVQESLTNIARHAANARSATVSIAQNEKSVTVEITNEASTEPSRFRYGSGHGLLGMRERVEAIGGTLAVGPRPGVGWSVRASLPVAAGEHL
ncbi:MAG: hypothetical protein JWN52_6012 [Actinomycetia bacterium]|nr:hypothetical protein [Actinomycetes bacterium]